MVENGEDSRSEEEQPEKHKFSFTLGEIIAIVFIGLVLWQPLTYLYLGGAYYLDEWTLNENKEAKAGKAYLQEKYGEEFIIDPETVKYKGYKKVVTFIASPASNEKATFLVLSEERKQGLYQDNYRLNKTIRSLFDPLEASDTFYYDTFLWNDSFSNLGLSSVADSASYVEKIKDRPFRINLFTALALNRSYEGIAQSLEPFVERLQKAGFVNVQLRLYYPSTSRQELQEEAFANIKETRIHNKLDDSILRQSSLQTDYAYGSCAIEITDLSQEQNLTGYLKNNCDQLQWVFEKSKADSSPN